MRVGKGEGGEGGEGGMIITGIVAAPALKCI